jgi:CRISPR-associated protein (TIGR03986 family)
MSFYNPYEFVPLAERVCQLSDEEKRLLQNAHDVPFRDSLSGKIQVSFEAMTPFCVREGGESDDRNAAKNVNVGGKYFVPASSLKGMVRSVFEIITLANHRNGITNNRYSMRDLNSGDYELKAGSGQESGFLIKINGEFYISPCHSEQVEYKDIEEFEDVRGLQEKRTVKEKYEMISPELLDYNDRGEAWMWFFSGYMQNKKHEYVFRLPSFENLIPLRETEYEDFIFIHEDENKNKSWEYWRSKIKNYQSSSDIWEDVKNTSQAGIAPCFFRKKKLEDGTVCVRDLGFAYLYRVPYKNSIHDFIPKEFPKGGCVDLAQAVFGYVDGSDALKGRVHFSHSFIKEAKLCDERRFILGSPKPTFYPFYLEQRGRKSNKLNTYFSNGAKISGIKRYLMHNQEQKEQELGRNQNVAVSFRPLDKGTEVDMEITFHNLRPFELGALIAAINFCNKPQCFHSLGYAKPYGYGKLRVNDLRVEVDGEGYTNESMRGLYKSFVDYITSKTGMIEVQWEKAISTLFEIAQGNNNPSRCIRYPELKSKTGGIDFSSIKKKNMSLSDFSPIKK